MKNVITRSFYEDNKALSKKQESSLISVSVSQQATRKNKADLIAQMFTPKKETVSSDRVLIERMVQLQLQLKGDSDV